ncbi:T9SS sorting signal type C domain-containing protein [Flavobacterium sp. 3HN19-14]|uniref:T9SS sorting signal type C domain-containing protein n=1 Tax=Flavobacterium sp. 3HN19-14 TaxID=3448133 RepID=UPI003EE1C70B
MGAAAATGGATPNGYIQAGQGFLLKTATNTDAIFTNDMRSGNNDGQFFRTTNNIERHRIWLNLYNGENMMNQALVGYITGATNEADASIDGIMNYDGSSISSIIGNENYTVQGRPLPFAPTDVIPLNFKALAAGTFTISLDHADGLFSATEDSAQDIFIKDEVSGIVHNIKESPYVFAAEAGTTANRFSIVFENLTLGMENPVFEANNVVVFEQNQILNINSGSTMMSGVKVFDTRGRLIFEQSGINSNTVALNTLKSGKNVLLVQVKDTNNYTVTKKVVY